MIIAPRLHSRRAPSLNQISVIQVKPNQQIGTTLANEHHRKLWKGNLPKSLTLVAMFLCWFVFASDSESGDAPESTTEQEPVVVESVIQTAQGAIQGLEQSDVWHFRGIPYAAPPLGDLRFKPPVSAPKWEGTLDATNFPNRCAQPDSGGLFGAPIGAASDDCLYLNIVTPSVKGQHRPVLFWIHGGGFVNGSANDYDGSVLAKQGDVVVVTINYRLGLLGFLDLSSHGEAFAGSASNGIRDQIAALEWVRDNIGNYGGDASNVTIFGESAGGASVNLVLASPSADGLYHKAIAHSPGTSDGPPADLAQPIMARLGATEANLVEKLQGMTVSEILAMQQTLPSVGGAVDGTVVTRNTATAITERGESGVPVIAGTNRDEGKFFMALFDMFQPDFTPLMTGIAQAVTAGSDPAEYLGELRSLHEGASERVIFERVWDALFRKAAIASAESATAAGKGGWLYQFDLPSTKQFLGQDVGATHAVEIPFTFNSFQSDNPGALILYDLEDPVALNLAQRWSDTVLQFAKTGDPNGAGLPEWPRYDAESRQTMILDAEPSIERDINREERLIWEHISQ